LPVFWSRRKPDPIRGMQFESGQIPQGEARPRLAMQYYPYLLMFAVLDVASMFLFAWGMSIRITPVDASFNVLLFLFLLGGPLVYALSLATKRENW